MRYDDWKILILVSLHYRIQERYEDALQAAEDLLENLRQHPPLEKWQPTAMVEEHGVKCTSTDKKNASPRARKLRKEGLIYCPEGDIWQVSLTRPGLKYIKGLLDQYDNNIPVESCRPLEEHSAEKG